MNRQYEWSKDSMTGVKVSRSRESRLWCHAWCRVDASNAFCVLCCIWFEASSCIWTLNRIDALVWRNELGSSKSECGSFQEFCQRLVISCVVTAYSLLNRSSMSAIPQAVHSITPRILQAYPSQYRLYFDLSWSNQYILIPSHYTTNFFLIARIQPWNPPIAIHLINIKSKEYDKMGVRWATKLLRSGKLNTSSSVLHHCWTTRCRVRFERMI